MSDATPPAGSAPSNGEEWFGHPRGLFYLFFAEMWERFCFYGMRNILVLYMVDYFLFDKAEASKGPYAAYTALIYCVALPGGYIADKFLGYRKSIMFGGIVMAIGMILMLLNDEVLGYIGLSIGQDLELLAFYLGLATIIMGNGYFKPNISTIVGKLYGPDDPRRDGGFTIFYMGINVGAFVGGLACGWIGEKYSWPLGFGLAALGMLLGVAVFGSKACGKHLHGHGDPADPELAKRSFPKILLGSVALIPVFYLFMRNSEIVGFILGATGVVMLVSLLGLAFKNDKIQREKIFALLVLLVFNVLFWAFFEQAGSSLTLFAKENLNREFFGWVMPASWAQNLNPLFIVTLAPLIAGMWVKLAVAKRNPSIPMKFALGLLQLGLGFGALALGCKFFSTDGITPFVFIVILYLLNTTGELFLSPVGLSMVTKLAPAKATGMVMGAWFLSISAANFVAGQIAALTGEVEERAADAPPLHPTETLPLYQDVYLNSAYVILAATALLILLVPLLKKWMHGVK